jgi:hypothetical protein
MPINSENQNKIKICRHVDSQKTGLRKRKNYKKNLLKLKKHGTGSETLVGREDPARQPDVW